MEVRVICLLAIIAATIDSCSKQESLPLPQVTTSPIVGIQSTLAESGGIITSDGGSIVKVRGLCWSINPVPTINDSRTLDGSGIGSFVSSITGLSPNTSYYVRAYATNVNGTAYGAQLNFNTLSPACQFTFKGVNYAFPSAICQTVAGVPALQSSGTTLPLVELILTQESSTGIITPASINLHLNANNPTTFYYSSGVNPTISVVGKTWNFSGTLINTASDTGTISGSCACSN